MTRPYQDYKMKQIKLELKQNLHDGEKSCSCCAVDLFEEKPPFWKRQILIRSVISGVLLVIGLIAESLTPYKIIAQLMFIFTAAVSGKDIFTKAFRSVLRLRLDMNCLMSIAAFGAFFIGHGEEGAAVIFLFFVAEVSGGICR